MNVLDQQERVRFEQVVLPHLDSAFNLSRWLLRSRADAEDVAQEGVFEVSEEVHERENEGGE